MQHASSGLERPLRLWPAGCSQGGRDAREVHEVPAVRQRPGARLCHVGDAREKKCRGGAATTAPRPARARRPATARRQSAILSLHSALIVLLLFICSSTYLRAQRPSLFREKKPGCRARTCGVRRTPNTLRSRRRPGAGCLDWFIKPPSSVRPATTPALAFRPVHGLRRLIVCARPCFAGTRLSPYVSLCCVLMAFSVLFF